MTSRWVAVLALLAACGDDAGKSTGDALIGSWLAEDATGFDCGILFVFDEGGTYEYDTICSLEGGGYGVEGWTGDYQLSGDTALTLTATHSTCAGATSTTDELSIDLDGDRLKVIAPGATFVLSRLEDDGDGTTGTVRHGCFADDGAFTPGGLVEL